MALMAKPIIPQTRIRFVGERSVRVPASIGATVAIPLVHDWGPLGTELTEIEVMEEFAEWTERYGDSDTEGRTAVAGAFNGQGIPGALGAGGVIPWRMGTGAVRALIAITNTTPTAALTLRAKWAGTRGNDLSYSIDADPTDAARDRLRIRYKGAVVDTYLYPKTAIQALADSINARDTGWVTAATPVTVTGVALTPTAGTSLATGTNGSAPDGAAHLAAQSALEFQPFTLVAPANLTDAPIRATYVAWVQALDEANRPAMFVEGGAAAEVIDDAITRTTATADPHVVNFGVGTWQDDLLGKQLSTAQLAPRIAGALARLGETAALTGAEFAGLHPVGTTGPDTADAELAVQRGVTVLIRTDSDDADVRIAMGLTTFTSDVDAARPRYIFSEPRFVRIMDLFVRRMKKWGDKNALGKPNNEDLRDAVRAYGSGLIDELLRQGLILTKAQGAEEDPFIRTPVSVTDVVPFEFGWQFAQTANFLLGEGRVR